MEELLPKIQNKDLAGIWHWVVSIDYWNTPAGWVTAIVIVIVALALAAWIGSKLLEGVAKGIKSWKTIGLPTTLSAEKKLQTLRRQQFCKVLRGDLENLNKAENWNDQFFTDLEAEVEAEGHYYASTFHWPVAAKVWRSAILQFNWPNWVFDPAPQAQRCLCM